MLKLSNFCFQLLFKNNLPDYLIGEKTVKRNNKFRHPIFNTAKQNCTIKNRLEKY